MVKDGEDKHGLQIGDELKKHRLNFSKRANLDVVPLTASYCSLFLLLLMKPTLQLLIFS